MCRLDHYAIRCVDRNKTADFFMKVFGYQIPTDLPEGFDIEFEDGSWAKCLVLTPPEKKLDMLPWTQNIMFPGNINVEYHLAPEIFISDGSAGSVVKEWVDKKGGTGNLHHIAYQVDDVAAMMEFMKSNGYAEFTTEEPIQCEGLTQVFTKPSELTGIIYEFISRDLHGFCKDNVKKLMDSTKNL